MSKPNLDVVVFGATSFVGQILARYLFEQFGVGGELRWAAAGRSGPRLEELRKSLGRGAGKLELLVADAADEASLRQLCAGARVVVSTVGPYALYGEPLVRVCAESGTDYCDLTGEVQWMKRMIDRYEDAALLSGARIVHNCGFDSIPSDLGVHFLQQQARAKIRPALRDREDAGALDARRLFGRHGRLAAERAEGSGGRSRRCGSRCRIRTCSAPPARSRACASPMSAWPNTTRTSTPGSRHSS